MSEQLLEVETAAGSGFSAKIFKQVTLRVTNGRCFLERSAFPVGDKEFVGLYENGAIDDPWGSKAWKWSSEDGWPYATNVDAKVGFVAVYYGYDFYHKKYVRLAVTPALTTEIIESNGSVTGRTTC